VGVPRAMAPRPSIKYPLLSPAQVAAGECSEQATEIRLYTEAVEYCKEFACGAKAYCKQFPNAGLSVDRLHRYLRGKTSITDKHADKTVLTHDEEVTLAEWLAASAANHCGKTRAEARLMVVEILTARQKYRQSVRQRKGTALSAAARKVLASGGSLPSDKWWQSYYARHGHLVQERTGEVVNSARAARANNNTVEEHFFDVRGLEPALLLHGIMDPVTKRITDPRRLLNLDETPQPVNYERNVKQRKVAAAPGGAGIKPSNENRRSVTIDITMDLGGFLYGPHIILAQNSIHEGHLPEEVERFDGRIDENACVSHRFGFGFTDDGCQTAVSFLKRMKSLHEVRAASGLF
jgi:hypothetical protein